MSNPNKETKKHYEHNRKCFKCGSSISENPKVSLHRFPKPGVRNIKRCELWAKFCFPDTEQWASSIFQQKLHSEHRMLCSRHFHWSSFLDFEAKKLNRHAVPENECRRRTSSPEMPAPPPAPPSPPPVEPPKKKALNTLSHKVSNEIPAPVDLETDSLANDDNDISDRCPSPEVLEEAPQKVVSVLCAKCTQLIKQHMFVCASCSRYEPWCVRCACADHQSAHAACYVLRADVTRPKSEIVGVLCAIRSELAINSFAEHLDDTDLEIKSEVDSVGSVRDSLDMDPLEDAPHAEAGCEPAPTLQPLSPDTLKSEDEGDSDNQESPSPHMIQEVSEPVSPTATPNMSNVVKVTEHDDPKQTYMTSSVKTDDKQMIQTNAGPSGLKRCQQNHGQNDDVKKIRLNKVVIPIQSLRPQGFKMQYHDGQPVPPGVEMLSKGVQPIPSGVKMLCKGAQPIPQGVKMLSKDAQPIQPGVKITLKGFSLNQKTMAQDDNVNPPVSIKSVQVKSDNYSRTSQTVTDDAENVANDCPESVMFPIVVLKNLHIPASVKNLKIINMPNPK